MAGRGSFSSRLASRSSRLGGYAISDFALLSHATFQKWGILGHSVASAKRLSGHTPGGYRTFPDI
jgi:hypothetical protein